jgi:hypothetical protein
MTAEAIRYRSSSIKQRAARTDGSSKAQDIGARGPCARRRHQRSLLVPHDVCQLVERRSDAFDLLPYSGHCTE